MGYLMLAKDVNPTADPASERATSGKWDSLIEEPADYKKDGATPAHEALFAFTAAGERSLADRAADPARRRTLVLALVRADSALLALLALLQEPGDVARP